MKKLMFALIAGVAAMSAVHAEGGYVGAGVLTSRYNFDVAGATGTSDKDGYKANGKLFGGYEFDKTWGVEAGYADLGNARFGYTTGAGAGSIETSAHSVYVAGKASMPLNEQFSLFGKLGVARNHYSQSGSGVASAIGAGDRRTDAYAALGGQYKLSKEVALTLEWERYGKNNDFGTKSNAVTAAARYNF